jgi:hypothetical protein
MLYAEAKAQRELYEKSPALVAAFRRDPAAEVAWCLLCGRATARLAEEALKKERTENSPPPDVKPHKSSLNSYLIGLESLDISVNQKRGEGSLEMGEKIMESWRRARVFHIDSECFIDTQDECLDYAFAAADLDATDAAEISNEDMPALVRAHNEVPPPCRLPFPDIFLGYGRGIVCDSGTVKYRLLGHLISDSGLVASLGMVPRTTYQEDLRTRPVGTAYASVGENWEKELGVPIQEQLFVVTLVRPPEGPWGYIPFSGCHTPIPWALLTLVDLINDHNVFVISGPQRSKQHNQKWKKTKAWKGKPKTPEPYYLLTLKKELRVVPIGERLKSLAPVSTSRRPPDHRWDTRGHERVRVQRGPKPLDDATRALLKSRGYNIYEDEISGEDYLRLMKRPDVPPKQPDEWIALKTTWVKSFVNGPKEAPYVPAVRRMAV